jgi:hypothetical protein
VTLTEENHLHNQVCRKGNLILPDASVHYRQQHRIIYNLYTGLLSAPERASVNKPSIFVMHIYFYGGKKLHLIFLKIKTAYIDAGPQHFQY